MEDVKLDLKQIHELINDCWKVIRTYYNAEPTDENAAKVVHETDAIYAKYKYAVTAKGAVLWTVNEIERHWRPDVWIGGYY